MSKLAPSYSCLRLEDQPDQVEDQARELADEVEKVVVDDSSKAGGVAKAKKEQLTKAQKRKMWNRGGLEAEERPRGWDWIDVIRHLSQTGAKPEGS